ncbi:RNA methyltransferase [uncultured Finegoldia sp.]|uniref:TrmH family RNA methyltransferase n=1 Tax=uncultured Finegoldia sp. TaxID=328009 RepID=UPI0026151718|nr:RNA methyltransferase [uncultured Finegoldia sp.]
MITSTSNKIYKHCKSLYSKKFRYKFSEFIIEGYKLYNEALRSRLKIKQVILREGEAPIEGSVIFDKKTFDSLSEMNNSEGIICVVEFLEKFQDDSDKILFLENINDPGNLGTIIRSAEAFGYKKIIMSHNSCDIYNLKTVRSAMGSLFRLSIEYRDISILNEYKNKGFKIYETSLEKNSKSILEIKKKTKHILIIGNEANGISNEIKSFADEFLIIPMDGITESLNASIAASLSMFYLSKLTN